MGTKIIFLFKEMLITISRELCIGAAPCVAIAGDVFQLDEEGKCIQIGLVTDEANTRLAAEACPVRAIFIYDDAKIQLYPPEDEMPYPYVPEPILSMKPANNVTQAPTQPTPPEAQEPPKAA